MNLYCNGMHFVSFTQTYFKDYDWLMLWISYLGDPRYCLLLYFPMFYCFNKTLGLKIVWVSSITEWLNAILKWCFRDDRPYWWENESCTVKPLIQFPITCETGPGFPSGHVMGSTSFIVTLIIHFCDWSTKNRKQQLFNFCFSATSCVFVIFVAISRLFIAAHFLHQVVVGMFCGVVCAVLVNKFTAGKEKMLIHQKSIIVALISIILALVVYYTLLLLDLDPNSSIEKAKSHCQSAEWLHIDTTIFHSFMRVAGAPAGLGIYGVLLMFFKDNLKSEDIFKSDEPIWYNFLTSLFICQVVLHTESYQLPKSNEYLYYLLTFFKYLILPLYVIVLKNISELLRQFFFCKKYKCK